IGLASPSEIALFRTSSNAVPLLRILLWSWLHAIHLFWSSMGTIGRCFTFLERLSAMATPCRSLSLFESGLLVFPTNAILDKMLEPLLYFLLQLIGERRTVWRTAPLPWPGGFALAISRKHVRTLSRRSLPHCLA